MNPELAILKITGFLAAEVAVVGMVAVACNVFVGSAVWRRTLWQVCVLSVLLLTGLELSGLGRSIVEFARQPAPAKEISRVAVVDQISGTSLPATLVHATPVTVQTATKPAPPKNWSRQIALALACVWVVGAAALLCRIMLMRAMMLIICARSTLVSEPALLRSVTELAARMGIRNAIRVIKSPRFRGPIAFGLVRRIIGLPPNFDAEHSPPQQEVILAHELAHLAARDSWWQLLADVAVAILWWHPFVWLARRRMQEAAETAADEASLMVPSGPSLLAECLLSFGKKMGRAPRIRWLSIGGDGFRSGLGRRVQRLLELRQVARHPRNKLQMALAKAFCPAGLVLGTVLSSGWISPAASMKGTEMSNPMWKRSLPAFALLAFLGAEQQAGAADQPAAPTTIAPGKTRVVTMPKSTSPAMLRQKLKEITMDIQADNLPLGELIRMLIDETRKQDPEKEGINILLYNSEVPGSPAIDPATGLPIPGTASEPIDLNSVTVRIMPPLRNVRLIDALDAIMKVADHPLRYSIEDYGVVITQARSKAMSDLETRTFIANPPDIFFKGIKATFGIEVPQVESVNGVSRETQRQVFEELFRHLGIDWASPKSVFYNELTGIVMVRAAAEDMPVIAATMETLGARPLSEPHTTAAKARK